MTTIQNMPSRDQVRWILAAAADVVFSDGVPEAFLDQWADETMIMLSVSESARVSQMQHRLP